MKTFFLLQLYIRLKKQILKTGNGLERTQVNKNCF